VIVLLAVLASIAWVAVVLATPVLPGPAGAFIYGIGSFICHQIPERSFHLAGFQLPVCARCLGIYAGAAVAMALTWMRVDRGRTLQPMRSVMVRYVAVIAAAPTMATVALEAAGAWAPSNVTRALASAPLGAFVGVVVMIALATLHYDECVPQRPTVPKPPQRSI